LGGHNVVADASCAASPTDVVADPQLAALANGVRMPAPGSPATDLVPTGSNPATLDICNGVLTDQLGRPRPHGTACDAGAVETNPAPQCPTEWTHLIAGNAAGTLVCADAYADPVTNYQLVANGTSGTVSINASTGAFTVSGALSGATLAFTASDGFSTSAVTPHSVLAEFGGNRGEGRATAKSTKGSTCCASVKSGPQDLVVASAERKPSKDFAVVPGGEGVLTLDPGTDLFAFADGHRMILGCWGDPSVVGAV